MLKIDKEFTVETLEKIKQLPELSSHQQVKRHFLRGGYPDAALAKTEMIYAQWMENYFATYINRDIRTLFPKLDLVKYRRLTQILTNMSGQIINKSNLARAIEVSDKTISDYLDIADGTFVWRTIHSFERSISKSLIKMSKGGYRDSGLLHFHKNILSIAKLDSSSNVGHDFEHFVIEEIAKGLEASFTTNWKMSYYRIRGGAEIDLILEGTFGIVPIEIKYGMKVSRRQLTSLGKFIKDYHLPFGIVINNGNKIEMLTSNIIQIPITYL